MMKYVFKIISLIGLLLTSVIFGIVFMGTKSIPDEIHLVGSDTLNVGSIFEFHVNDENLVSAKTAFSTVGPQNDISSQYTLNFTLLNAIPIKSSSVTVSKRQYVVAGGEVFGIKLYTDGIMIVGMDDVTDGQSSVNPGKLAGLECGDVITAVDGVRVNKVSEITDYFQNSTKSNIRLSVSRDGRPFETDINLIRSESDNSNKAGLWVRDSTAGVGTVTYYDKSSGVFAGLGHAVCDVDTCKLMPMLYGDAVGAVINGCYKGSDAAPGELCGVFTTKSLGSLYRNSENGIYGRLKSSVTGDEIPVATRQEIKTGPAQIISTVDSEGPKYYDVKITRLTGFDTRTDKNMIIEVTDTDLIAKTGGIVQGMSGSPIIQNGMLVGAVTHVFVNNPKQGYAIFAESMLETSQALEKELEADKAS